MPASDVEVEATFTEAATSATEWVLTSPSALTTGDVVLIVDKFSARAMSNNNGTDAAPSATSVTLNSDKSKVVANVTDALKWNVTNDNGTFQFTVPSSGNYLYATNTNNGVRVGNQQSALTNNNFTINNNFLYNTATSRYLGVYNNQDWRCYTSSSTNISETEVAFYKKVETGSHSVTVGTITGEGNITPSSTSANTGDVITVTAEPASGYELTALAYNGTDIDITSTPYTFTMPNADVTLTATFSKVNYTLSRSSNNLSMGDVKITDASGNELGSQPTTAQMGDVVYFKTTTVWGYQLASVTVTNTTANATITPSGPDDNGVYSFTMPAGNVTIAANFMSYHGTLRLAGHFNGHSAFVDEYGGNTGPTFEYTGGSTDSYSYRAYFTGTDDNGACDYFCLTLDGVAKYPSANGNFWITNLDGTAIDFNLGGSHGNNFRIVPGVYDIVINGALTSMTVTRVTPTITFSPAAGEVEQGTAVSATSSLTGMIAAIKATDSGAAGTVTVGVNTDNGNTWNENETLSTLGSATVYGKAYIGNISVTDNASYTVVAPNTNTQYQRITSETGLVAGKKYIIVSEKKEKAAGFLNSGGKYLDEASVSISNDIATVTSSDVQIFTLGGNSTDGWTFTSSSGIMGANSSKDIVFGDATATNVATISFGTQDLNDGTHNEALITFGTCGHFIHNVNSTRFKTYTSDYNVSMVPVQLYKQVEGTVADVTATPSITPGSSDSSNPYTVYGGKQVITITCATDEATIYYTTDGSTPTTSSYQYSVPFDLTSTGGSKTVKAIAVKTGLDDSEIATSYYLFTSPAAPTFDPVSGTVHTEAFDVTITSEYEDAEIRYMIDPASAPTATILSTSGTLYENPVNVSGEGSHIVYAMVIRNGIKSDVVNATYTITSGGTTGDGDYVKVTSTTDLTDGEYLIVYEDGPYAFNGALSNLDATPNTISVEINDYTIPSTPTVDAAVFTFDATAGTFMNANGVYIGRTSNDNGLESGTTALTNTVSIDEDENAVILSSGGAYLRYNSNSNQEKFRYFKSSSYTNQQPVALYKKVDNNTVKAPVITPEGGVFLNSEYPDGVTVTIAPVTDGSTVYYTTDGTEPSAANGTEITASTTITVTTTTTVQAIAILGDEASEVVSETYQFTDKLIADVEFSPIPGTYSGAQTLQMYSTAQNAKIYYEISDAGEPGNPNTSSTLYSNTDVINLLPGHTYQVKAIAYVGNNCSEIASGTYIINNASSTGLNSIAELNAASTGSTKKTMNNPIQVIYMNTWRHKNGTNNTSTIPEYAYIRDNTGYSMVYFGNGWYNTWVDAVDNPKICQMGDWIPGGVVKGAVQVWSDGFHNELGGKNNANTVTGWPTATDELTNTPIIPEEMTNTNINAGWSAPASFATTFNEAVAEYVANNNLSDNPDDWTSAQESAVHAYAAAAATNNEGYIKYVQDGNVWGHYVHLRKNTIRVTNGPNANDATDGELGESGTRKKYSGFITDQSGDELTYYDAFYNFSGFNGTPNYSNDFFQNIQNNGGTFDVYGIVGFYGPKAADAESNYTPFEVFPIDFLYIYKPIIHMGGNDYNDSDPVTTLESQTVTITCATEGATIYYKTSDMEDYAVYTPGTEITVDATTTIETYSSIPTQYNDVMESVVNTLVINIGSVPQPIISPESGVYVLGVDDEDATIAFDANATVPTGTIIYFTVDGSDPSDVNSARYEYTTANITEYLTGIDETTTVRAIAYAEVTNDGATRGYYSREAEARTYTFVKSNGIKYNLVTDQTQLNESSVYVVVNKANNMAISTTQNANNRGAAGVKFVDEATKAQVYGNDDLAQFTLKKVGNKWYIQTTNSSENGYLYVGNGNTLLTTGTAIDAAEATINIDADAEHQAHISFVYDNEVTRYLRYYNGGQAFSTYTSETSNLPVSLYYIVATPLANIEKEGVTGNQYTIADQLIAVHCVSGIDEYAYLWCKDQGNVSIAKTEKKANQIDYMREVSHAQSADWDQSNWVVLKFKPTSDLLTSITGAVGHYLKPASITGTYTDDENFTITMPEGEGLASGAMGDKVTYTPNVFSPANFLESNLTLTAESTGPHGNSENTQDNYYFFMNPKIQEVATVTYAVWNGSNGFVIPEPQGNINAENLNGAFKVNWKYNNGTGSVPTLTTTDAYRFKAAVQRVGTGYGPHKASSVSGKEGVTPSENFIIYPLDLTADADQIVTSIKDVADVTGKAVAGVKYYNLAGMESDRPFEGVNIIVTTYTDGSRSSAKVLK